MTHPDPKALEAAPAEEKVSELLACPFCNKPAHVEYPDSPSHMMEIGCPDNWNFKRGLQGRCNVAPAATGYTYAETAERWNRRTPTPVTEDVGAVGVLVVDDDGVLRLCFYEDGPPVSEGDELYASSSPPKADGPGEDGWQLITDGVRGPVTVCCFGVEPDHNWLPMTAYRVSGGRWERPASRDGLPYIPTHWRPLPVSPSIKREA